MNLRLKKLRKLVHIYQSYRNNKSGLLFLRNSLYNYNVTKYFYVMSQKMIEPSG